MELYQDRQMEIAMQDLQRTATQLQDVITLIAQFITKTQQHIDQTLIQCDILHGQVQEFSTEVGDTADTDQTE